jgi:cob(I)alamin adenosyltransferase
LWINVLRGSRGNLKEAQMTKGLLMVFTGNGKGKTTAALGMALRAAGHGLRVLILQFIKGAWSYGELEALKRFEEIEIIPLGTGFTWKKETLEEDVKLARSGWAKAAAAIEGCTHDMIVLDELNYVLSYGLLPLGMVLEAINNRPSGLHVVITGRGAPEELMRAADLVTEMVQIRHPYHEQGIKAQPGIEF